MIITKKDFAIKTDASACLKWNTTESYPGIEKKFDETFVFSYCIRILFCYNACRNEGGSDW